MPNSKSSPTQKQETEIAEESLVEKSKVLPALDRESYVDPVKRAASRISTVDHANMTATDNTVDVDGKRIEARRGASASLDNVIYSNASLENSVPAPAQGLGGIDSRPGGNFPQVAPRAGWRVRYLGPLDTASIKVKRTQYVFSFELKK